MFMRQFKTNPIIWKCRQNKLLCVFKCSINLEFAIAVLSVLLSNNGLAIKIFYNSICIRMPMTPLSARLIMQRPRKRWFREDLTLYWEVLLGFNLGIICDKFLIMALNRMWVRPSSYVKVMKIMLPHHGSVHILDTKIFFFKHSGNYSYFLRSVSHIDIRSNTKSTLVSSSRIIFNKTLSTLIFFICQRTLENSL